MFSLEKFDVPVMLRKFDSGVVVIQSKTQSDEEVFARIESLIKKPVSLLTGITAVDAARTLGVAPAVAKEYLLAAEGKELLCRDVSPDGFRFYLNLFPLRLKTAVDIHYGVEQFYPCNVIVLQEGAKLHHSGRRSSRWIEDLPFFQEKTNKKVWMKG